MELHRWLLATRSGESLEGVDVFPPDSAKRNAEFFTVEFNEPNTVVMPDGRETVTRRVELVVPEGHELVFKRRVTVEMTEGRGITSKRWRYILNFAPLRDG